MKAKVVVPVVAAILSVFGGCSSGQRSAGGTAEPSPKAPGIEPTTLVGIWQGVIEAGGQKLRLVFHLDYRDGAWSATADSPDQGVTGIPVESVKLEGDKLTIEVRATAGRYEGVVQAGGASVTGKWLQGGGAFAVDLARVEAVEQVRRPQDPVPPYPYDEREVRFRNEEAGITLAGTLTVPRDGGPFPAVVLVSGSGAQNRNEELLNHRPFLVLADYLTRKGVAVLRYDDRGVAPSEGDAAAATTLDLAGDALAAFRFLVTQAGVDPARVGIAGHSEGGIIAPMVASEHPEVAFIVLLAGPGVRGYELFLQQSAAIMRASGASEAQVTEAEASNRQVYDVVLGEPDDAKAEAGIRKILGGMGMTKATIDAQLGSLLSPWYRYYMSYDPAPALRKTACPVLALNGSLDLQVPADANLAAVEKALREGGNTGVKLVKLEGLNHLFQHATTGLVQEYLTIEETFAPEAMEEIASWLLAEAGKR